MISHLNMCCMFHKKAILYIWILSDVWVQLFQNFCSQLHICSLQSIILFQYILKQQSLTGPSKCHQNLHQPFQHCDHMDCSVYTMLKPWNNALISYNWSHLYVQYVETDWTNTEESPYHCSWQYCCTPLWVLHDCQSLHCTCMFVNRSKPPQTISHFRWTTRIIS